MGSCHRLESPCHMDVQVLLPQVYPELEIEQKERSDGDFQVLLTAIQN